MRWRVTWPIQVPFPTAEPGSEEHWEDALAAYARGHSSPPTILSAWPAITLVDDDEVTIGCINRQPEQSFAVVIALAFIMLRTDNKEPQLPHYARASDAGGTPNGSILKVAIYTHPHKQDFSGFTRSWRRNRRDCNQAETCT